MNDDLLRMSDAERDQAATELGEHYAQGRLTTEEYTERLDRIWSARTRGELAPLFRDLPGHRGPVPTGTAPRPTRGAPVPLLVVLAVLVAVSVATHLPLILAAVLVWVFVAARHRRRTWSGLRSQASTYGPGA